MRTPSTAHTVTPEEAGTRLDALLAALCPGMGLRGRRRLCQQGRAVVNGRARPAGHTLRAGDVCAILPAEAAPTGTPPNTTEGITGGEAPRLLTARGMPDGLYFCSKPAGLHTLALAGSNADSLEARLPGLFPPPLPRLLTRLDGGTSGIVTLAATPEAAVHWHAAEDAGQCRKYYLALLAGRLEHAVTVTNALDTRHRATTAVLERDAAPLRHTTLAPLLWCAPDAGLALPHSPPPQGVTLALCGILKGARHQIRAHAAHAGHPLWGDTRYGGPAMGDGEGDRTNRGADRMTGGETDRMTGGGVFFLHHALLLLDTGHVHCPCPWLCALPVAAQEAAGAALCRTAGSPPYPDPSGAQRAIQSA